MLRRALHLGPEREAARVERYVELLRKVVAQMESRNEELRVEIDVMRAKVVGV